MTGKNHGGAGRGQGRKKAVDDPIDRIAAGSKCEWLWNQRKIDQARAKYDREPITQMIRTAQKRVTMILPQHINSSSARETLEEVNGDIEAALAERRPAHAPSLIADDRPKLTQVPLVRPKNAKAQVIAEAISWFKKTYGIELSPFRMRRCWDEYRAFADDLRKSSAQQTG